MSALLLKADMCGALTHVCFGPKADMRDGQFINQIAWASPLHRKPRDRVRGVSTVAKHIELVVGAQACEVGQTVRHTKKSGDCRYIPNLVIAEAVLA
jgi:hypothetical protein